MGAAISHGKDVCIRGKRGDGRFDARFAATANKAHVTRYCGIAIPADYFQHVGQWVAGNEHDEDAVEGLGVAGCAETRNVDSRGAGDVADDAAVLLEKVPLLMPHFGRSGFRFAFEVTEISRQERVGGGWALVVLHPSDVDEHDGFHVVPRALKRSA